MRHRNPIRRRAPARLGMDELMIVNPAGHGIARSQRVFLDADGELYRRAKLIVGPCLRCARRARRIRNF